MAQNLWKIENQETSPVPGVRIQSQAVSLRIPLLNSFLIWNRPLAVLTTDSEGQTVSQPITDVTRWILLGLVGGVLGIFVLLLVFRLMKKEIKS